MKVKDLIEQLQKFPPDTEVWAGAYCEDLDRVERLEVITEPPFWTSTIVPPGSIVIKAY